jgi:type IV pilus assembly protein PilY1
MVRSAAVAAAVIFHTQTLAGETDISPVPLGSSSTALVKPNILFVLDDSGSMSWSHMPDALFDSPPSGDPLGWTGLTDKVGYRNYLCNTVYYNPNTKYLPPRKADGTSYPDASFTDALYDPYLAPTGTATDLSSKFKAFDNSTCWNSSKQCGDYFTENAQAAYYYTWKGSGSPVDSKFTNLRTGECAKPMSGGTNPGANWEKVTVGSTSGPGGTDERTNFANWYSYYRTRIMMMKAAGSRAFVQLGSQFRVGLITINPGGTVSVNRYLPIADFDSTQKASWFTKLFSQDASGGTPLREALSRAGRHFAGYQNGINSGMTGDPVQYSCQQNFTILTTDGYWNGNGGEQLDGTTGIANHDGSLTDPLSPRPMWDGTASSVVTDTTKEKSYTYSKSGCSGGRQRIRETISTTVRTRKYSDTELVSDITGNPTSTSSNYTGCSNSPGSLPAPSSATTTVTSAGAAASSNSLSDVAQYYYITDLRTASTKPIGAISGKEVTENNVPAGGSGTEADKAAWQHMTTFTLGLGLTGELIYDREYQTAKTGDFADIRAGAKTWPKPVADSPTALDDLWHAAVNGRGKFFSAREPDSVVAGLADALAGINARVASASAAATSNLEPVAGDNSAYTASYTTQEWSGDLQARSIDLSSGVVSPDKYWSAMEKLDQRVGTACDNRNIYLFRSTATNKLVDFKWNTQGCDATGAPTGSAATSLDSAEQGSFGSTKVQQFSQYTAMSDGSSGTVNQRAAAAGATLVNFVRGQTGKEGFITNELERLYRTRSHVLGDIVDAQPVFVKKPFANYGDAGYAAFKSAKDGRVPMVYVAANDGMLHAFYAGASETDPQGGEEAWAFIPTMVLDKLWKLADNNYANLHEYFVDGTPTVSDVADASGNWQTILVGGLNGGGRGYFALDVTDPSNPKGLWEFKQGACFSGTTQYTDCNLGFSFGNPIISKIAWSGYADGRWVVLVTSGYNNVNGNADDGKGFLYALDALTGQILLKIGTGQGSAAQPSGLGKINNWVNSTLTNNYSDRVYGVDLSGNIWRFDVNNTYDPAGREAHLLATVKDASNGTPQPITTKPELAEVGSPPAPFIYVATGRYLGGTDIGSTQKQTIYAIKDPLTSTTLPDLRDTLVGRTVSTVTAGSASIRTLQCDANCSNNTDNGWYVDLPDSGERVNVNPKLQLGTLVVASNVPKNSECTVGGYSYLNFLNFRTGLAVSTSANASIGYKVADALAVGFNILRKGDGNSVVVVTTSDAKHLTESNVVDTPAPGGRRTSWRELMR